ncbi:Exopolygalacturonase [Carex littledalei]|uniref:Exopolygalacturonase n=1 Tax=Carex littledalei TaxID=544730 RepID=A0A833V946_9POAL|nr:Exopolygalacturonase [Carex littledalei]
MNSIENIKCIVLLFLLACTISAQGSAPKDKGSSAAPAATGATAGAKGSGSGTFDVKDYGAAWTEACAATGNPTIVVSDGSYLLGPVNFEGPCKAPITIQLNGKLLGSTNLGAYKENWVVFYKVTGLTITGTGTFDGQGASAWPSNKCRSGGACKTFPMSVVFAFVENGAIRGIKSLNSKYFHFNIFSSKNIEISNVGITAPEDSPNTDGIHLGDVSNITIADTTIGTGDDCISIGPGSTDVTITGVNCGPGHGISIGSLGKYANEKDVSGITVKGCTLTKTTNGLRIKTFQNNPSPVKADNIHFEDITMDHVTNPILIDQQYCPNGACTAGVSTVAIRDVTFKNIKGIASNSQTITINCSEKVPCTQISLSNIQVTCPAGSTNVTCANAKGQADGTLKHPCF